MNGVSFRSIADLEQCSTTQAHRLYTTALAAICPQELIEEHRQIELDRLDRLQLGIWAAACDGDIEAINAIIRIITARCRLLGLYNPRAPFKNPAKMTSLREIEAEMRAIIDEMNRRDFWAGTD